MVEVWSKEPPKPRTLTVSFSGLSRAETDRLVAQAAAMGHSKVTVVADDGLPLPDTIAVVSRVSQFSGTALLRHVVGEEGAVEVAERLAGEAGRPVLACHAPATWEEFRAACAALAHRRDSSGWYRLGAAPGVANVVEAALTSAKGGPAGLIRLPVAERVSLPEEAR